MLFNQLNFQKNVKIRNNKVKKIAQIPISFDQLEGIRKSTKVNNKKPANINTKEKY